MTTHIFFDMGSTLLDETDRVRERIATTAVGMNMSVMEFTAMLQQAAKTQPYVLTMELPGGATWSPWPDRLDPLYPGALELLRELSGRYRLGVIANHGADIVQQLGIAQYFDAIAVSQALGVSKPDLRIFQHALERAGCEPERAIMIGDRLDNDIVPAKKLGMRTVWIRQGWGGVPEPRTAEEMPDEQVQNLEELRQLLCST